MWPLLGSRPDIAFATGFLGRFNLNPTTSHYTAQKRLLRYLKGTTSHGILFRANSTKGLVGFLDLD
jgi:hypothetical protein